jgi:hypothetical protein
MYAAWEHNPQGAFCDNGSANWIGLFYMGWPLFVFSGGAFALMLLAYFSFIHFRSRNTDLANSHWTPMLCAGQLKC